MSRIAIGLSLACSSFAAANPVSNGVLALDSGGRVEVPHNPSQSTSSAVTIEFWVRMDSSMEQPNGRPFAKRHGSGGQFSVNMLPRSTSGVELFGISDLGGWTCPTNQWVHFATTWSSASQKHRVYVNGEQVTETTTNSPAMSQWDGSLSFGDTGEFGHWRFQGRLDNIRYWNVERTRDQLRANATRQLTSAHAAATPGLIGSWTFDALNATDGTGVNNGSAQNGAFFAADEAWTGYSDSNQNGVPDSWEVGPGDCGGPVWETRSPTSRPPARWSAQSCFMDSLGKFLVFGGWCCGRADTWTWDGTNWSEVVPAVSPPGRLRGAMTWDSGRKRAVLFGGIGSSPFPTLNDTWEFDGTTWINQAIPGPSPRQDFSLAYDPIRQRVVLFGGQSASQELLGETWEYDGTQWALKATTGPEPRVGGGKLAYDPTLQAIVLSSALGGPNASVLISTVWAWNGSTWTQLPDMPGSAAPGDDTQGWTDTVINRAVFLRRTTTSDFGPARPMTLIDNVWTWAGPEIPSVAFAASVGFDSNRSAAVVFGGALAPAGPASNATVELRYANRLAIGSQPTDSAVLPGAPATLSASLNGTPNSVRWRFNGAPLSDSDRISGASTNALTIQNVGPADQGVYELTAENNCDSVTSNPVDLSCKPIILQSAPSATPQKRTLALALGVPANAPYTYAWRRNGVPITNLAGVYSGAFTNTLRILSPDFARGGTFDCVLTDICGETISASTRVCLADFNLDTSVDDTDFVSFAKDYDTLLCADADMSAGCFADFNNDTVVDDADFLLFAAAYDERICP
jgi:hypothetical protein